MKVHTKSFEFLMFLDILALRRTPPNAFGPPLTDSVSGKLLADFSEMLTPPNVFTPPNTVPHFTVPANRNSDQQMEPVWQLS